MLNPVLVPLIGLPGAGKSSLAKNLNSKGKDEADKEICAQNEGEKLDNSICSRCNIQILHFDFDKFLPVVDSDEIAFSTTKAFRKAAVFAVDCLLKATGSDCANDDSVSGLIEKTEMLIKDSPASELKENAIKIISTLTKSSTSKRMSILNDVKKPTVILILLDDNNIYRSMRYEYYQLAREHRVSFLQLHVRAGVELAKSRDASRAEKDRVGDETIDKMAAKLEAPNPEAYPWEKRSCVVDTLSENLNGNKHDFDFETFRISDTKLILNRILKSALEETVQPVVIPEHLSAEQRELDRQASLKSVLHQSDVKLRNLVSQRMKELQLKEGCSKAYIKSEAAKLAKLKASIYEKIKSGELELDLEVLQTELEMLFV